MLVSFLVTQPAGFRLLIVGIGDYKHWRQIPVIESAESIESSLQDFGADPVDWARNEDGERGHLTRTEAGDALRRWFHPPDEPDEAAPASPSVNTVLYWGGHGDCDSGRLWLMTHESPRSGFDSEQALEIDRLGRALQLQNRRGTDRRGWTLVILDCCQGGVGIQNIIDGFRSSDDPEPDGVGFLAAADGSASYTGELSRVVAEVLTSLTGTDEDIPLWELVRRVAMDLGNDGGVGLYRLPPDAVLPNPEALGGPLTSTVESLVPLENVLRGAKRQEIVSHFLNKAQGTELDERAWYFEGRAPETRRLVQWLATAEQGLYVVTGDPGAGKSAFLGRMVVFAEPVMVDALLDAGLLQGRPTDDLVPPDSFDAVVHLTAKSYRETLERFTEVVAQLVDRDLDVDIEAVLGALTELDRPVTFLVDALDEALDPFLVAASLLRRLAAVDGVRVVVGTRRSLEEGPDQELDRTKVGLINALGFTHDPGSDTFDGQVGQVHPLDPDPEAVERYVTRRLTLADPAPYAPDRVADIAQRIRSAEQPFLFARLATTELIAQPVTTGDQLDRLLASGHQGIFAAALDRFDQADEHTVPLLRALAYSLGRGFPRREGIWKKVTEALHPGLDVRERDIGNALDLAAAYIVHDGEFGQATYRLAHRTFAEHFLSEP